MATEPARPSPGDPIGPVVYNAKTWSKILNILAAWDAGRLGTGPKKRKSGLKSSIAAKAVSDVDRGSIQVLTMSGDPIAGLSDSMRNIVEKRPVFTAGDPVWHSNIDNAVVMQRSVNADWASTVGSAKYITVDLDATDAGKQWAMIDPDDPTTLKAATGGIFKVMKGYAGSRALLDTQQSQRIWRYELNENSQAPATTDAKLVNLDGTTFATSINLSDPLSLMDDQTANAVGFCWHIGNEFYAIQGPCQ